MFVRSQAPQIERPPAARIVEVLAVATGAPLGVNLSACLNQRAFDG